MNKLFTKIASAFVGIAMAVGVGVALGVDRKAEPVRAETGAAISGYTQVTSVNDITSHLTGNFLIAAVTNSSQKTTYLLPNTATAAARINGVLSTEATISDCTFTLTNEGNDQFSIKGSTKYYGYSSSTSIAVYDDATTNNAKWTIAAQDTRFRITSVSSTGRAIVFRAGSSLQFGGYATSNINNTEYFDVELYYEGGSVLDYTITYDANGGGGEMSPTKNTVAACGFTGPDGKDFVTWNTQADGKGTNYSVGATAESDLDLYAIWTSVKSGTINFGSATGSTAIDGVSVTGNDSLSNAWNITTVITQESFTQNAAYSQVGSSSKPATSITFTMTLPAEKVVKSFSAKFGGFSNTAGDISLKVGETEVGSGSLDAGNDVVVESTAEETGTVLTIEVTNIAKGVKVYYISYTTDENAKKESIIENSSHAEGPFEIYAGGASMAFMFWDNTNPDNRERIYDDLDWSVSDATVLDLVTTSTDCSVSGLKEGTATLSCEAPGYKKSTVTISVVPDPTLPEMDIWDTSSKVTEGAGYKWSNSSTYPFYATESGSSTHMAADSWSSSDANVATIATGESGEGVLTCVKPGDVTITATKSGYQPVSVEISIISGPVTGINVSGSMTKTTYTPTESWDPAGLVVKAEHDLTGYEEVVTESLTWEYNPASPTSGCKSVVATATYNDGEDDYVASSEAQAVNVLHAGTQADPYTVEDARYCIDNNTGKTGVYAVGVVTEIVTAYSSQHGNITFNMSSDGKGTSPILQAYRCTGSDSYTIDSDDDVEVGATVVVYGNLTKYNSTYEFGAACKVVEYTAPSTGDIDVSINAPTNPIEVGHDGTLTITTTATNPVCTWSVEEGDEDVLSINASTGEFEALAVGVARVNVNVTADEGNGHTFIDLVVNGFDRLTVTQVNEIGNALPSGSQTQYYIYVTGYVSEFATSKDSSDKPRALDICNHNETDKVMIYTNTDPYSAFIDGLSIGTEVVVKGYVKNYNGTIEVVNPEKIFTFHSAMEFAANFLSVTDSICKGGKEDYDGVTNNKEALEAVWDDFETAYNELSDPYKSELQNPATYDAGNTVKNAMARYDYVAHKYKLDNFIGRSGANYSPLSPSPISGNAVDNNSAIIIVTIIAITSVSAIGALLVIKRRKSITK